MPPWLVTRLLALQWMWPFQFLPILRLRSIWLVISEARAAVGAADARGGDAGPDRAAPCCRHQVSSAGKLCFCGEIRQ